MGQINETLNESFKGDHISDQDFKKMLEEYQNYLKASKNLKDAFIDRTYVEKSEIRRKLMSCFSLGLDLGLGHLNQ